MWCTLWFDVGIKRYTTVALLTWHGLQLWFDVGIKRYTTARRAGANTSGCGLM